MWFVILSFIGMGCQSKKQAILITCNAPKECLGCKLEEMGPYLKTKLRNREVINLLENLTAPETFREFISKHNLGIDQCLLMDEMEKLDEQKPTP